MKERLRRYARLLTEIELETNRNAALSDFEGYRHVRAREGISDRLRRLQAAETAEHAALVKMIEELPCAEQRQVIFARYFDGHSWAQVAAVLFGRYADFYEKAESYERRVYRLHGNALANLNRIEAGE